MGPVDRIGEQVAQHVGAMSQVVDGLEQRRDVERHLPRVVDQAAPARQRQHGQHVGAAVRHADDVGAQRIGTVPRARIGQGLEDRIQPFVAFLGRRR